MYQKAVTMFYIHTCFLELSLGKSVKDGQSVGDSHSSAYWPISEGHKIGALIDNSYGLYVHHTSIETKCTSQAYQNPANSPSDRPSCLSDV